MSVQNVQTATLTLTGGVQIPQLGLGVWQTPRGVTSDAVQAALRLGYRHIDTARIYGNEEDVGRGVRESKVPRDADGKARAIGVSNILVPHLRELLTHRPGRSS